MSTGGVSDSPTTPRTPATEIMRLCVMGGRTIRDGKAMRSNRLCPENDSVTRTVKTLGPMQVFT
jgi:hypothetical protein